MHPDSLVTLALYKSLTFLLAYLLTYLNWQQQQPSSS